MTRKNKSPDWIPKNVIPVRGFWVYRPYVGRKDGKTLYGPQKRLTKIGCSPAEFFKVFNALGEAKKETRSINWLFEKYHESKKYKSLAKVTRDGYDGYRQVICKREMKTGAGKLILFGDVPLAQLSKPKIQKYIDTYEYPISANRHIQYLSAAWSWAERRFENMPLNPCLGVEKNKQVARDRYITDDEFLLVYECALSFRVPIFGPAMQLAYLMRARRGEVFALMDSNLKNEGVFLERAKGSENEITAWSERLRDAVEQCRTIHPQAPTPIKGRFLLHDKRGLAYTKNALDSAWRRVIDKAKRAGLKEHFTFHDIKAKGATDHKTGYAGHLSEKMRAVYQRKPKIIESTR